MRTGSGPAPGAISFQVLTEIAVGSTARVDLCRAVGAPRDGQLLAVKRLHPHLAEDPAFANPFFDEIWMTASLRHPNVVEVAGWGRDAQGTYLAVELVQGVSLARLMKTIFETGEEFSERMVVFIASQLCRGLAAAHALRSPQGESLQLVHRDLTPGNVLVSFQGEVKITDFGLAKAKQRITQTATGLLKGQPAYMAPEQARGQPIDSRADLFSLGVMLFELFAGKRPWNAASEIDVLKLSLTTPPADLLQIRPKLHSELVAIVMGCLEKDPAKRFQSAVQIQERLDMWLDLHGYRDGNDEALARFVRRNAMRQMRWFERAIAGLPVDMPDSMREAVRLPLASLSEVPITMLPDSTLDAPDGGSATPRSERSIAPIAAAPAASSASTTPARATAPAGARAQLPARPTPAVGTRAPLSARPTPAVGTRAPLSARPTPPVGTRAATPVRPTPAAGTHASVLAHPTPAADTHAAAPARLTPAVGTRAATPVRPTPAAGTRAATSVRPTPAASTHAAAPARLTPAVGTRAATPVRPTPAAGTHASVLARPTPAADTHAAAPAHSATPAPDTRAPAAPAARTQAPNQPHAPARELPDIDWGEEIPTLVQRSIDPPSQQAPASAQPSPVDEPIDVDSGELLEDDSTDTETLVEPRSPHSPLVQAARAGSNPAHAMAVPPPDTVLTEQLLRAHADRLATEAARLSEQARAAAAQAEHMAALARTIAAAATKALEAIQIAPTAGFVEAGRRLAEALALEQNLPGSAALAPSGTAASHAPSSHAPSSHPPPSYAPSSHPPPSYATSSHPPPSHATSSHVGQPSSLAPAAAHALDAPPASSGFTPAPSAPLLPQPDDDSAAEDAFRAHLSPKLFGLPRAAAIGLIAGAVLLLVLILILRG